MTPNARVLVVALAAGLLGLLAALLSTGPGPLLGTEAGQRVVQRALSATAPPPPGGVAVAIRGQQVPPLRLSGLDGRLVAIPADFAGKPLLINLWASWCGPCIEEMPELERFSREQAANGVQVVGIALDEPVAVQAFLSKVPVTYPILLDQPGPADAGVRLGNPKGVLPYSVLLAADGRLLRQRIGPFESGDVEEWARP